jgi:uncharacterized protein
MGSMETSWIDPRIAVGKSDIHGQGLAAAAPIAKGEVVIRWQGEILPVEALEELKTRPRYDCAAISEDQIIVFQLDDPAIRGNHSCDPNLWMEGAMSISARRDIKSGEELTIDYALHSDDSSWNMKCVCGSAGCRGDVTGRDWQLPELHRRYAGHFEPYLEDRFRRLRQVNL